MILGNVYYFRIWKPCKCILFSYLKTMEVYTIFRSERPGSVYYFRIWKPWKCVLFLELETLEVYSIFSELKTLEVYTIFGSENLGRVYYFRIWKPWKWILFLWLKTLDRYNVMYLVSCSTQFGQGVWWAKPPRKAGGFGGPLGPPMLKLHYLIAVGNI